MHLNSMTQNMLQKIPVTTAVVLNKWKFRGQKLDGE